jgi:hypothetical protein
MPTKETMTQEQVRALLGREREPATSIEIPKKSSKPGDGSRYGKRHESGVMNKTEAAFAARLEIRKVAGDIISYRFEQITLTLAKQCTYKPDFMIVHKDHSIEFVDVKGCGPINETSIVKIKMAAKEFRLWQFSIEKKLPKNAGWDRREF